MLIIAQLDWKLQEIKQLSRKDACICSILLALEVILRSQEKSRCKLLGSFASNWHDKLMKCTLESTVWTSGIYAHIFSNLSKKRRLFSLFIFPEYNSFEYLKNSTFIRRKKVSCSIIPYARGILFFALYKISLTHSDKFHAIMRFSRMFHHTYFPLELVKVLNRLLVLYSDFSRRKPSNSVIACIALKKCLHSLPDLCAPSCRLVSPTLFIFFSLLWAPFFTFTS